MEKPIKVVPSSSGGKIAYFSWGLRHTQSRRVRDDEDDFDDEDLRPNKSPEHKG